jgi:beta-lactamase regulating signal transducer with metallopeptidase domain
VETLLLVGVSNAVVAGALAVVAAAAGRLCRRPALTHSLWLIVLIKLVTPPLVHLSVPVVAAPPRETPVEETVLPALPEVADLEPVPPGDVPAADPVSDFTAPAGPPADGLPALPWASLGLAAWATGSALWLALAAWRAVRFHRLLRFARPAPDWLGEEAAGMARRLGLRRGPGVWLVPGQVSPMLWPVGGVVRLFLPADLLDRLTEGQRQALLVHELAHLRRRDHWVRALEAVTAALYWWHPAVWWARRELREAEEQCCDAWVVWALPGRRRDYALALVETVDFLSESRAPLPALASGVGHVDHLRRRVTMIMKGATPRRLSWVGGLVVGAVAMVLLPVLPVWGQDRNVVIVLDGGGADKKAGDTRDDKKTADEKRAVDSELAKLEAEVEAARAQLAAAEARLRKAKDDLAAHKGGGDEKRGIVIEFEGPDGKKRTIELPPGARVIEGGPDRPKGPAKDPARQPPTGGSPPLPETPRSPEKVPDNTRPSGTAPVAPKVEPPQPPGGEHQKELEKKLDSLLKEVEELRKELHRKQDGPAREEGGETTAPSGLPAPIRP